MPKETRFAVIDAGTLKVKFEIREFTNSGHSKTLYKDKKLTVLGRDLQKSDNKILESSAKATIEALQEFKQKMIKHRVNGHEAITTEAIRRASNSKEVLERIARETGITLQILTHEDEAKLFFHHIAKSFPDKRIAVADIGGGSVQLIVGTNEKIEYTHLFKTGTYFMQEQFSSSHHPTSAEIEKARQHIKNEFANLTLQNLHVDELIYGSTNIINFMQAIDIPLQVSGYDSSHPHRARRADLEKVGTYSS